MRTNARRIAVLTVVSAMTFAASRDARAQQIPASNGGGTDVHLFRPAMDSKGLFSTNGTEILGANDVSFGLVIDYGNALLRVDQQPGQTSNQLIDHDFQGTFQFNYGILNQLHRRPRRADRSSRRASSSTTTQGGQTTAEPAERLETNQLNSQDARVPRGARQVAHHARRHGIGLGARLAGRLPRDRRAEDAQADPSFWYWPQVIVEKRFGPRASSGSRSTPATAVTTRAAPSSRSGATTLPRRSLAHVQRRHLVPPPRAARSRGRDLRDVPRSGDPTAT